MYLPYLERINKSGDRATYAPRLILYLSRAGALLPVAIELALLPVAEGGGARKRVFTPGRGTGDAAGIDWPWHFAKTHFTAVDTTYQLSVSHWYVPANLRQRCFSARLSSLIP
jgi:hypothetical protein